MLPPEPTHLQPGDVRYQAIHVERHSRLTTFFRWFLTIPHAIVLFFYAIAAGIAVLIAWFAIVITARYPAGLHAFVSGFERYLARVQGYYYLLTDVYPPFSGDEHPEYPIQLQIGAPKEKYSRLLTFFRGILLIPVYIISYVLGILLNFAVFVAWIVIIIVGRLPEGLHNAIVFVTSYTTRAGVYGALLTEKFPGFEDGPTETIAFAPPAGQPVAPPTGARVDPPAGPPVDPPAGPPTV